MGDARSADAGAEPEQPSGKARSCLPAPTPSGRSARLLRRARVEAGPARVPARRGALQFRPPGGHRARRAAAPIPDRPPAAPSTPRPSSRLLVASPSDRSWNIFQANLLARDRVAERLGEGRG